MAKLNGVKTLDMVNGKITKVSFNSVEYSKVDGPAQAGDLVYVVNAWGSQQAGEFYEDIGSEHHLYTEESRNDFVYIKGNRSNASANTKNVALFRKKSLAIGETVRALADGEYGKIKEGEIAEIKRTDDASHENDPYSVAVETEDSIDYFRPQDLELVTEETLKVGDRVEVVEAFKGEYVDLEDGDIGTIVKIYEEDEEHPYKIETDDDYDWFPAEALRKVAEAKPKVSVGDFVKVVADSTGRTDGRVGWSERGQGLMRIGAIGEVIEVKDGKIVVSFDDDQPGSAQLDNRKKFILADDEYEKLSAEESAQAVFTKAGRKPNEYKKGDIVRIKKFQSGHAEGATVEVTVNRGDGVVMVYGDSKYGLTTFAADKESIEPIVFVENRLDRQ